MGKSGKGLKAALQSQQSRLKNKEKVAHAAQMAEQKYRRKGRPLNSPDGTTNRFPLPLNKDVKGKEKTPSNPSRRFTIPFKATDNVLLIGEGNFSFARALILDPPPELSFFPPENLTATAYDAESECYEKYPESRDIVTLLRSKGAEIVFGVDGTRLEKHPTLRGRRWDRICWNFPHAGKGITDQDRNILSNQLLVLGFLRSASKMLRLGPIPNVAPSKKRKSGDDDDDGGGEPSPELNKFSDPREGSQATAQPQATGSVRGTILITLRNVFPYTQWDIPRLAKKPPAIGTGSTPPNPIYTLLRSFRFYRDIWKDYEHRMTKGERAHGKVTTGEGGEDRTWEFCLRDLL